MYVTSSLIYFIYYYISCHFIFSLASCSWKMSEKPAESETFLRRSGTTAGVGFQYEILLCMRTILRCVKNNLKFMLKCNVGDIQHSFDDIECEVSNENDSSESSGSRTLFLQAKHLTGNHQTIFQKSKKQLEKQKKGISKAAPLKEGTHETSDLTEVNHEEGSLQNENMKEDVEVNPKEGKSRSEKSRKPTKNSNKNKKGEDGTSMSEENGSETAKEPEKEEIYGSHDIIEWYKSYKVIKKYLEKNQKGTKFELVFFTTTQIDKDYAESFESANTMFGDLLQDNLSPEEAANPFFDKLFQLKHSEQNKHLKPLIENTKENVKLEDLKEFCTSLKFFTKQEKSCQLEKSILSEMEYSRFERSMIFNATYKHMEEWHGLTGQVPVLKENIFQKISNEQVSGILAHHIPLEQFKSEFHFNEETIEKIHCEIQDPRHIVYICVYRKKTEILNDLLKQYIEEKGYQDSYIYMPLEKCLKEKDQIIRYYERETKSNILILQWPEYNSTSITHVALVNFLQELMNQNPLCKIIFAISKATYESDIFTTSCRHIYSLKLWYLSFSSLNKETIRSIETTKLNYLGEDTTFNQLNTELPKLIDSEMLTKIRSRKRIHIGCAPDCSDPTSTLYINRDLTTFNRIKDKSYFLSNTLDKGDLNIVINANITDRDTTSNLDISKKDAERVTQETIEKAGQRPVHILLRENEDLLYMGIYENGTIKATDLKEHIDKEKPSSVSEVKFLETYITDQNSPDTIIVENTAGMGKTKLAESLVHKLIKHESKSWPLYINLNKYKKLLTQWRDTGKYKTLAPEELLLNFLPEIQKKDSFRKFCTFFKKVIVLFDGFDEIAPELTDCILTFIQRLSLTNVNKIIIFTRPYVVEQIKDAIKTCAVFYLKEFSRSQIDEYLQDFFTKECLTDSQGAESREKIMNLENFVTFLVDFIFQEENKYLQEVTGVPLQTYMFATVFTDKCKTYIESPTEDFVPQDSNFDLYESFILTKLRIYLGEKLGLPELDVNRIDRTWLLPKLKTDCVMFALLLIFGNEVTKNSFCTSVDPPYDNELHVVRCGIVTVLEPNFIEFIHRSVAEYLCAVKITEMINNDINNFTFIELCFSKIFIFSQYKLVRFFFENIFTRLPLCLDSKYLSLPTAVSTLKPSFHRDKIENIFHVCAREGNTNIIKLAQKFANQVDPRLATDCLVQLYGGSNRRSLDAMFPLQMAAKHGHLEIIKTLLELGADINNEAGYSAYPISLAAKHGHAHLIKFLIENGADTEREGDYSETVLHQTIRSGTANQDQVVRALLENGVNKEARNDYQYTALHLAARFGPSSVIRVLFEHGFNIDAKDNRGLTPLHIAVQSKDRTEALQTMLEERPESVNIKSRAGETALHSAIFNDKVECVQVLIQNGADITEKDSRYNKTALEWAMKKGNEEIIRILQQNIS